MKAEEDEQLLQVISDALRDGPGTPAWEQATRAIDAGDGDELDALYRVRQRIESGKRWRQVRPGIGFTRKLMDAVDQQSEANVRSTGPATIIAFFCGVLVLAGIAVLVPMLLSHAKVPAKNDDELSNVYFATPWVQSDFANAVGGDWRVTGNLEVKAAHGLRVAGPIGKDGGQWGIVSVQSLSADQFFAFASKIDLPSDGTIAQVFVTDQKNELAGVINADQVQVMLPGAQLASATPRPKEGAIQVRWIVGPASAALEIDGQRVWAGANDLSGDEPRFVGVRFLVHTDAGGEAAIETVDVKTKN
jgi:hypothetical protein